MMMTPVLNTMIPALLLLLLVSPVHGGDLLSWGKQIAREGTGAPGNIACMHCHRLNGGGMPSIGSPRIAGQTATYIDHEIRGVQQGTRFAPIMAGVVQNLSDRDIRAVSLYYSRVRTPKLKDVSPPDAILVRTGERIAQRGLWKKNIPACVQCHGPDGRGIPPHFPYIAGQNKGYLLSQLVSFAFLKRKDDPQGLMRGIAGRLTPRERKAVAEYFASLPPPPGTGTP